MLPSVILINISPLWRGLLYTSTMTIWQPPAFEPQKIGRFDSKACTVFGTINCIEMIDIVDGIDGNYSERFTAILSGTHTKGNDPRRVAKAVKKYGLIKEEILPFSEENYYDEKAINDDLLSLGKEWASKNQFDYKTEISWWTLGDEKKILMKALENSPVGISVFGWSKNDKGLYTRPTMFQDNHFVALFDYVPEQYWVVFDSYEQSVKLLDWNYPFTYAYSYSIKRT